MATNRGAFTETPAAYVPAFVVQRPAVDPPSIPVPSAQRAEGGCLFVDVADSTPLTAQLARVGAVGVEKTGGILNDTFRPRIPDPHR